MPPVHRRTDLCSGHGCWPSRPSATWSPNVFVNNLEVERFTDMMEVHCCDPACHDGVHIGRHTVFANKLDIQVHSDPIDCGSYAMEHSPDVFVDG